MNVPRKDFYEKEIDIRISCSYGPGRYDQDYEDRGNDYPVGYVRWTENRNMEAAVDLMADRRLLLLPLITHRIPIEEGTRAYDLITGKTDERYIGILLSYPPAPLIGTPLQRTCLLQIRSVQRVGKRGSPASAFWAREILRSLTCYRR